jgi:hypothetical protein
MKKQNKYFLFSMRSIAFCLLLMMGINVVAQKAVVADSTAPAAVGKKKSFVKNTFEGNYLIDNQSVMVPVKGTFEFDIQHRFATWENGFTNLFGMFGGATMRLGLSYVPIKNLQIGFGASNEKMLLNANVKYALLRQTKDGSMPVSITYFGDVMADPRKKDNTTLFVTTSDRFSFFNQIIIARKISEKLSVQVSPSLTHFNNLEGYIDDAVKVYKITPKTAIIVNYDQPLTQHPMDNPHPNISFGLEMATSGHQFQVFAGNYGAILPQTNNMFNQNDFTKNQFLIGFNITRLWNF